jgi:hypothetical protein
MIQLLMRRGKASLIKQLTRQEDIEAKCYECSGGWPDGITKSSNEVYALRPALLTVKALQRASPHSLYYRLSQD